MSEPACLPSCLPACRSRSRTGSTRASRSGSRRRSPTSGGSGRGSSERRTYATRSSSPAAPCRGRYIHTCVLSCCFATVVEIVVGGGSAILPLGCGAASALNNVSEKRPSTSVRKGVGYRRHAPGAPLHPYAETDSGPLPPSTEMRKAPLIDSSMIRTESS